MHVCDDDAFVPGHCSHPRCTLGQHSPDIPHSFEQVSGPRRRSAANVASAVEGDVTGTFAAFGDVGSVYLGTIDGEYTDADGNACDGVPICINLDSDAFVTLTDAKDGVPQSTP